MAATLKGITTIVWGTPSGIAPVASAIVRSCKLSPVGGKIGNVEDGDGAEKTTVLLDDGFDAEIVCELDTSKTWPVLGDVVAAFDTPTSAAVEALVVNQPANEIQMDRKGAGSITIRLEYRPGVNYTP
jgi:hypothetical protein